MFTRGRKWIALLLVVLLTVSVIGCGKKEQNQAATPQDEKMKVGFIYIGPVEDAGWTYAHDQGRQYLAKEMPDVETIYKESVPENAADAERELTALAEQGCKVIFATSFGYMDSVINVAKKYPDVIFMHCSGYKTAENVGTYFGRIYQARYLAGVAAGLMTKSNIIGYDAAFPIPEVIRGINAFTLGVRSVNPDAKVKVVWTNTWYDPVIEKQAAESLLAAGADIITQHSDTPSPQQAAQAAGKYGIGYNSDMSKTAPKAVITSPVWNWGPYYVKVIQAVKNGTWKSEQYWGSMSDGIVDLAPFAAFVPEDVKKAVDAKKQAIIKGEFDPFDGPIKDQQGNVRVEAGKTLSDEEKLSIDWFVEGVEGTIPKQ